LAFNQDYEMTRSVFAFLAAVGVTACSTSTLVSTTLSKAGDAPDYAAEARRAMDAFDATGLVAAVTIDGERVFEQAFGKVDESTDARFTTDTLVPIASISKAFTSTALAILVDRGLVEWDAPVRSYIPEFAMYDPWVSENFSVRDALTHRSGLPLGAGDLLFWPDAASTVDDILAALPHLEPSTGFRTAYAYDNLLYVVAGEVVARVSGQSWGDFIEEEIFAPIGMDLCAADTTRVKPGQAVVTGHERAAGSDEGVPVPKSTHFKPDHAAAGGILCPAGDVMRWAQFWLDGGVTQDGEALISQERVAELWSGVTPVSSGPERSSSGASLFALYGLGWFIRDFEGQLMLSHSGGAPGVASNLILLPEQGIGIFASANDYRGTAKAFTTQVADGLIDGQDHDYIAAAAEEFSETLAMAQAAVSEAYLSPASSVPPSQPLAAYVGIYRDQWYGDVGIELRDGQLFIDMSRSKLLDGPLSHFDGERFVAAWPNKSLKADAFVTFELEEGVVKGFKMEAISELTDFSYDFHDLNLLRVTQP
jgi:CubicO group peptidase (beta-lactamase class C family)